MEEEEEERWEWWRRREKEKDERTLLNWVPQPLSQVHYQRARGGAASSISITALTHSMPAAQVLQQRARGPRHDLRQAPRERRARHYGYPPV